jgi:hypothetical protein
MSKVTSRAKWMSSHAQCGAGLCNICARQDSHSLLTSLLTTHENIERSSDKNTNSTGPAVGTNNIFKCASASFFPARVESWIITFCLGKKKNSTKNGWSPPLVRGLHVGRLRAATLRAVCICMLLLALLPKYHILTSTLAANRSSRSSRAEHVGPMRCSPRGERCGSNEVQSQG